MRISHRQFLASLSPFEQHTLRSELRQKHFLSELQLKEVQSSRGKKSETGRIRSFDNDFHTSSNVERGESYRGVPAIRFEIAVWFIDSRDDSAFFPFYSWSLHELAMFEWRGVPAVISGREWLHMWLQARLHRQPLRGRWGFQEVLFLFVIKTCCSFLQLSCYVDGDVPVTSTRVWSGKQRQRKKAGYLQSGALDFKRPVHT